MVALQIRGVEDEVGEALVRRADERGQSLQGFLLDLVRAEARRTRNIEVLRRFSDRSDGIEADEDESVADLIRGERAERREARGTEGDGWW